MISLRAWETPRRGPARHRARGGRAEHTLGLADAHERNAIALAEILGRHPVALEAFPKTVMDAARKASNELIAEIAASSALSRRIVESYTAALNEMRGWSALSADMARSLSRS